MKFLLEKNKVILLSGAVIFCFALMPLMAKAVDTLIEYPEIGGQKVAFGMTLQELIRYIYLFAIGICGAVALTAILLGAIKYVGAAGNPSKMTDAKEQIFSAILGVIILLSSYLILNTINPDLVLLNPNPGGAMTAGTTTGNTTGNTGNYCYCTDVDGMSYHSSTGDGEDCAWYCDAYCRNDGFVSGSCRSQ